MNNAYIDINIRDYRGINSLSSYALSSTPLLFYPEYTILDDTKNNVFWDFGDNTISGSISSYKHYKFPGEYIVTMVLYDCNNNSVVSSIRKTVTIYDFIPLTFNVETNGLSSKCGQTTNKFTLRSYFPPYQPPISIFYSVSGSYSNNFWNVEHLKYAHLENTYNVFDLFFNQSLKTYQYRDIQQIIPTPKPLYCKISNNNIITCGIKDPGAFFVGLSSENGFFYKDDLPKNKILLDLYFDKTGYVLPDDKVVKFSNNLAISIPITVIDNQAHRLSITSNGMDGEYYPISAFNINKIKYFDTKIPFIVKTKDIDDFTFKNLDPIEPQNINFMVLSSGQVLNSSNYEISFLFNSLSSQNTNGSVRAYIKFSKQDQPLENIKLSAVAILTPMELEITGESNEFNVYPCHYYDMYKHNEDFNASDTLKELIFQEILINNDILFDNFLGGVYGDINSDHEGIYLKIYEKIANFVSNTRDVDISEIDFLNSLADEVNFIKINNEHYEFPEKIKKLINLLSISKSKLFGTTNKFNENFNPKGLGNDEYGVNLGNQLTYTHWITAGNDIVALEKFSNTYSRLNTLQPLSSTLNVVYNLSSYTSDWGWPLVLPINFNTEDFNKYYIFFEYKDSISNTNVDGVIDFNNPKTVLDMNNLMGDGGVYDNLILCGLYESLKLIDQ